jgi:hypothetical protein
MQALHEGLARLLDGQGTVRAVGLQVLHVSFDVHVDPQ